MVFVSESTNLDAADTDALLDVYAKQPLICTIAGIVGDDTLTGTSRRTCSAAGAATTRSKEAVGTTSCWARPTC